MGSVGIQLSEFHLLPFWEFSHFFVFFHIFFSECCFSPQHIFFDSVIALHTSQHAPPIFIILALLPHIFHFSAHLFHFCIWLRFFCAFLCAAVSFQSGTAHFFSLTMLIWIFFFHLNKPHVSRVFWFWFYFIISSWPLLLLSSQACFSSAPSPGSCISVLLWCCSKPSLPWLFPGCNPWWWLMGLCLRSLRRSCPGWYFENSDL